MFSLISYTDSWDHCSHLLADDIQHQGTQGFFVTHHPASLPVITRLASLMGQYV